MAGKTTTTTNPPSRSAKDLFKFFRKAEQVLSLRHGVLDVLRLAVDFAPLRAAAAQALELVGMIQEARNNSTVCKNLVEDACHIVFCVYSECKAICGESEPYKEVPVRIMLHVDALIWTLYKIRDACSKITSRGFITSAIWYTSDKKTINKLHQTLNLTLGMFDASSRITVSSLLEQYPIQVQAQAPTPVTNRHISFSNCGNTNYIFHPTEIYEVPGSADLATLAHIGEVAADAFLGRAGPFEKPHVIHRIVIS
ncbi:hypothetical protein GALMADRAFT_521010 [Galerina marginata CBS 339.88]|uniref:Uncharacterized protein n=1 Tax=Galerina marginata (strain CBS 339.88) TaxID=685588 RepID=A0A067SVR6_GALM3|nr:hypothetical protein GALMADRAFT_521010 [Galerina marginata CBS 339.88]